MINDKDCSAFSELLFRYAEHLERGEAPADPEYAPLVLHLDECAACRAELHEYRRTIAALKSSAADVPAELRQTVMTTVAVEAKLKQRRRFVYAASAVAATFVIVVGLIIMQAAGLRFDVGSSADKYAPGAMGDWFNKSDADAEADNNINAGADFGPSNDGYTGGTPDAEDNIEADKPSSPDDNVDEDYTYGTPITEATPTDSAYEKMKQAHASYGCYGGYAISISGEDAKKAVTILSGEYDSVVKEGDGILVFPYDTYLAVTTTIQKLMLDSNGALTATSYPIDGDGELCIVVYTE